MDNNKKDEAYGELELVFPTKEYKKEVEEYLQEFLDNGENEIAGAGRLDRIKDFDKWLEKVKNDLSIDTIDKDRIPATVYLTIRKSDKKIVESLQIRHFLNEKLLNYGGHTEAKNLMKQLEKNIDKLNIFTNKYLKEMMGDDT